MTECPDDNLLVAYGAGSIGAADREALERHLDGCEICRTLAAEALQQDALVSQGGAGLDPEEAPTTLGPGAVLGRYVVLAQLGAGGMGTVYSAYDPKLERRVALKLLHADARTSEDAKTAQGRLLKEAQAMARLTHPNVVSIFDVGTWRDRVFLAMEYVDGGTLRSWTSEAGRTRKEILSALVQAGRGLHAAHAAGLVHRDFKPDNVLVSRDGRVLVTDFGLAHAQTEEASEAWFSSLATLPEELEETIASTRAGTLIGTPAYMAPEQLLRQQTDARSDQFAFCVTAWEALCGSRPFALEELSQLAAGLAVSGVAPSESSIRSGAGGRYPVPLPPPGIRLPAYVHRALLKGLRLNAERRHADMEALLALLGTDPTHRRRTRWSVAALSVALVAGATTWGWQWSKARALRCSGGGPLLAAVWSPEAAEQIRAQFARLDSSLGPSLANRVESLLNDWGGSWTQMHREACEASRVREEQTEEVLTLRMACLDRRLNEADALVRLFKDADSDMLSNVVGAAQGLPSIEACGDIAGLMAPIPLPEDPVERRRVEDATRALAEVRAQLLAGRYRTGVEEALQVWERAKDIQHAPTRAEASVLLGIFQSQLGQRDDAKASLRTAILEADRGRDDHLRAESAIALASGLITWGQLEAAEAQWQIAEVALARLGTPSVLAGDLRLTEGRIQSVRGEHEAAITAYRDAARLFEASFGSDSPKRAVALNNLASVLEGLGRLEEAGRLLAEAISIQEAYGGADHPGLMSPLMNLAHLQSGGGSHALALETVARLETLTDRHLPRVHVARTWVLDTKATVLQASGDYRAAMAVYRKSLTLKKEVLPPEDPDLFYSYDGIGQCLLELGRPAEAVAQLERAIELNNTDVLALGDARFALARALFELKRSPARVETLLSQVEKDYAQAQRSDRQEQLSAWRQQRHPVAQAP